MKTFRGLAIGIVASSALICAALVMAQQQTTPPTQRGVAQPRAVETSLDSRMIGVSVVRLINTAEARYRYSHGNYASWKELLESGSVSDAQKRSTVPGMKLSSGGTNVVPGWTLSLVRSADGKSYELSLRNLPDPCAFSFFSDQRGLIYQGGVIDCSIDLKPAKD